MKNLFLVYGILAVLGLSSCGKDDNKPEPPKPGDKSAVQIGAPALADTSYEWSCGEGATLSNPKISNPWVAATKTVTCTVTASTKCGSAKASTVVHVYKLTPNGELVEVK